MPWGLVLESGIVQPHQTLYGGAHLFRPDSVPKLGQVALRLLRSQGRFEPELQRRLEEKLEREPIEDLRIDFEDGYGRRPDEEEDLHADKVVESLFQARALPPRLGIRIKALGERTRARALRTLQRMGPRLREFPRPLWLTIPKTESPAEVELVARELDRLELDWPLELMVESPGALRQLPSWVEAAGGRLRGVHFGPFDFLASCGQAAGDLHHPLCRQAKLEMIFQLAPYGLEWADGPTTRLPVAGADVEAAWALHRRNVRASWDLGFSQSWDLHPAQLVSHFAEIFAIYDELLPGALERVANFRARLGQATRVGQEFDDMATVRVAANLLLRAGLSDEELNARIGCDAAQLRQETSGGAVWERPVTER